MIAKSIALSEQCRPPSLLSIWFKIFHMKIRIGILHEFVVPSTHMWRARETNDGQTVSGEFRYVIDVIVWQRSNELAAARKCDCAQVPLNIHEQTRTHWRQTKLDEIGGDELGARNTRSNQRNENGCLSPLFFFVFFFFYLWMPNTSTKFGRTHITRARALNKHDSLHAKIKRSDYELFLFISRE